MLKNHPKGLMTLFFTEMWERFGFYTMLAVFVLYMDEVFGWDDSVKGGIYGMFLALVYFTPIAGGWIADRFLGYRRTILIGGAVLGAGYALLALSGKDSLWLFYTALGVMVIGNGLFKANISVLVGNLYEPDSKFKDVGYNIFYMGINLGAFVAPLAATWLHAHFGSYNAAFGAAAVGMLLSLLVFEVFKRNYMHGDNGQAAGESAHDKPDEERASPEKERGQIMALGIIFLIVIFFWMSFHQNGFALTLFAKRSVVVHDLLRPETYQTFNPLFILFLTPLVVMFFNWLRARGKEPSSPAKIGIGMFISALAMVIMIVASFMGGDADANNMSPMWLVSTYFVITIGELFLSPMGLSFVSKVAPARMRGLMMGGWFGATAVGNYLSGFIGKFYSQLPHHVFFGILTVLLIASALMVRLMLDRLKRASDGA
ncbi:MAG: peptide MFS transporter [Deltaproteobacteria bacterium]|nr:peptide MFS transporter [Deltaproteobacteria bacterium]